MRRNAKADTNQPEIVEAFRTLGCSVQHLHTVGRGCPDIAVGYQGFNFLIEIKDGTLVPSKRQLTPDERDWHNGWMGHVCIVECVNDVIDLIRNFKMDTPEEYKEKFKGHWIDESCPNCGGKLISNEMGDVWCGSIICAFGIDDMRGDANVVKKGK